jgi:transcription elongation GreA/GreB family factor
MEPDLQALVDAGKLNLKAAAALEMLKPHSFCLHKSWGFGQIDSWNPLLNQIIIDFQTKKNHLMQLQYAAETLQPLSDKHLLVRKVNETAALKKLAASDPAQVVQMALESFGGKVTQDQLQRSLAPEIISEGDFKRWWDNTKKVLRKTERFSLPAKKSDPISARDQSLSIMDELILSFQKARQLKDQLNYVDQILKNADTFIGSPSELQPVVKQIEEIAERNQRLNPSQALELLISRDELCARFPELEKGAFSVASIIQDHENRLGEMVSQITPSKQRRVLAEFQTAFPSDWSTRLTSILQTANFRIVGDSAKILIDQGRTDELRQTLNRAIKEHSISSDALYWLCKERGSGAFSDLIGPEILTSALSALERDQFNEKRSSKLNDLLMDDRELVSDLIGEAPLAQARDLMRRMLMTPAFDELNKRSLLARMIKAHPDLQSMISGDSEEKREALIVSWSSLAKRKDELQDLISKKIPQNTEEIGIARSYGDLRENFEFKAAKEMQAVLMRRKSELEQMLDRARGTNFENVDITQVSIGTSVTIRDLKTNLESTYKILGAWDSAPEQNIISYLTAIGQGLLSKKTGEKVELPTETGSRIVEIIRIEACPLPAEQKRESVPAPVAL